MVKCPITIDNEYDVVTDEQGWSGAAPRAAAVGG